MGYAVNDDSVWNLLGFASDKRQRVRTNTAPVVVYARMNTLNFWRRAADRSAACRERFISKWGPNTVHCTGCIAAQCAAGARCSEVEAFSRTIDARCPPKNSVMMQLRGSGLELRLNA